MNSKIITIVDYSIDILRAQFEFVFILKCSYVDFSYDFISTVENRIKVCYDYKIWLTFQTVNWMFIIN